MEKDTTTPTPEMTPYEKTRELMRRLVAVPKNEAMGKLSVSHKPTSVQETIDEQNSRR